MPDFYQRIVAEVELPPDEQEQLLRLVVNHLQMSCCRTFLEMGDPVEMRYERDLDEVEVESDALIRTASPRVRELFEQYLKRNLAWYESQLQ